MQARRCASASILRATARPSSATSARLGLRASCPSDGMHAIVRPQSRLAEVQNPAYERCCLSHAGQNEMRPENSEVAPARRAVGFVFGSALLGFGGWGLYRHLVYADEFSVSFTLLAFLLMGWGAMLLPTETGRKSAVMRDCAPDRRSVRPANLSGAIGRDRTPAPRDKPLRRAQEGRGRSKSFGLPLHLCTSREDGPEV